MKLILASLFFIASVIQAQAQQALSNEFQTQTPGKNVSGFVEMCINSQGQAVPTAGGNCIGGSPVTEAFGSTNFVVSVTPTVQNAAYASGNAIGGLQTIPIYPSTTYPYAVLDNVQLASKGGSTVAKTLYLWTKSPASTCTDKTAFSFTATDAAYLVPGFPKALTPVVIGAGTTASFAQQAGPWSTQNQDGTITTNIYACLVEGAADTPASTSDLVLSFAGIR